MSGNDIDKPRWLDEQPAILRLLIEVIDRLENKPAAERKNPPGFAVDERHLPELFRIGEPADRLWLLLKSLANDYGVFTITLDGKRAPFDPEYKSARLRFNLDAEDILRRWLNRPRDITPHKQWQAAVDEIADLFPGDTPRLRARQIRVEGKTAAQVLRGFLEIAGYQEGQLTLRQLSARCFWGQSKLLDGREALIADLYPALGLTSRPLVVSVHLPLELDGVLFIENQDSYTSAVAGAPDYAGGMALVYCAGFKGSARRIRETAGVSLHYRGDGVETWRGLFEAWWFARSPPIWPVFFWGDLDYAGMAILKALKQRFDAMQAWQAGYRPLLDCLQKGGGHRPDAGDKQEQGDPQDTGCAYADTVLLPALRAHGAFVDQETVF